VFAGAAQSQTVWKVDADAQGAGDGTTWADAFPDVQAALGVAGAGDEIWVAEGIYTPSEGDATSSFVMKSGVSLYGGFEGTELSRVERDWRAHVTVLSGDIGRDDVVGSGAYWYANWQRNTANCGHVLVGSGADATAILDGFTVSDGATGPNGTPAGDELMFGSGIYIVGGSPTIRNCVFKHNLAAFAAGGAIYCLDASPTITHCDISENYVHSGRGGGVFTTGASAPVIEDCTFSYNQAVSTGPDTMGAGVDHEGDAPLVIERCTFHGNVARCFYSSGSDAAYGGGLASFWAPLTVRDCIFTSNEATIGGGVIAWQDALLVDCVFVANKAVPRPNDPYGEGGGFGAGALIYSFQARVMDVVNCTIAFNTGKKEVGVLGGWNGEVNVHNCIVWGNTASHPDFRGYYREQIGGSFNGAYSCIQNIFGLSEVGGDPLELEKIPGCIDGDPLLAGPQDPRPMAGSPCLDAGSNPLAPAGVEHDFDGLPRFVDDPATPDTGIPGRGHSEVVDMGAFELQAQAPCRADFNGDGLVDTRDVLAFLNVWSAHGAGADFNGDGAIDTRDVIAFLNAWTTGCE
jgi:hypothetical protein